jgi:predicted carbohydrate-binding protein with CBM5 and CBM33 domain
MMNHKILDDSWGAPVSEKQNKNPEAAMMDGKLCGKPRFEKVPRFQQKRWQKQGYVSVAPAITYQPQHDNKHTES